MKNIKVEITNVNTSKLNVLTGKEKQRLFILAKNGDVEARDKFIQGNLKLILSIVKRFNNRNENVDDLFQIGCVGLIKAIDNFDVNQNVQFSTYAVPMIIGEIKRYLRDNTAFRVSRSLKDIAYKAMKYKEEYFKEKGIEPLLEEISEGIGEDKEELLIALDSLQEPVSLYEPAYNDGNDSIYIMDQIKDKKNEEEIITEKMVIKELLDKLDNRERYIVERRFFEGKTQMEIAEEIGISQAQISRIEKTALLNMKKRLRVNN